MQTENGILSDWDQVPGYSHLGFPVVDVSKDGSIVVSKPEGTGGLLNRYVMYLFFSQNNDQLTYFFLKVFLLFFKDKRTLLSLPL